MKEQDQQVFIARIERRWGQNLMLVNNVAYDVRKKKSFLLCWLAGCIKRDVCTNLTTER